MRNYYSYQVRYLNYSPYWLTLLSRCSRTCKCECSGVPDTTEWAKSVDRCNATMPLFLDASGKEAKKASLLKLEAVIGYSLYSR